MPKRSRFTDLIPSTRAERDLTSMIDVVFLLLIFFLCSMQFRAEEGTLDTWLPRDRGTDASSSGAVQSACRVTLYQEAGSVFAFADHAKVPSRHPADRGAADPDGRWGEDPVIADQADLESSHAGPGPERRYLRQHLERRVETAIQPLSVVIDAEPGIPSAYVLWVVDLCRELEIPEVRIAVPESLYGEGLEGSK